MGSFNKKYIIIIIIIIITGNVPTDELHGLYYELRASAGLIISEGSQISKEAVGYQLWKPY